MSDEIGSGDSLVSLVQDGSISPTDLVIPVHNVALECGFLPAVMRSSDTRVQCFKTTVLFGDRCGNRSSREMIFPDMSGTTSTDEEGTIDVSVDVVSCCNRLYSSF